MADSDPARTNVTHDYSKYAGDYATLGFEGSYYLAFRDIPALLERYPAGARALDYGCGTGRSTQFLARLGYSAVGVDISPEMLDQARAGDHEGEYHQIRSAELPFSDSSFDIVFSSFVFIEVSTLDEITRILAEMKRVLKPGGIMLIVTSPVTGVDGRWVSFSHDFPENRRPIHSGDTIKVLILGANVVLYDYHWPDEDHRKAFSDAGLAVKYVHTPLGRDDDGVEWLDERTTPFIYVYALEEPGASGGR